MRKVGVLYDNISGNVGDVAVGLSVRRILRTIRVPFEELVPGRFNPNDYRCLIIGGGDLLRPAPNFFYDKFRIPGRNILNTCGIAGFPDDLHYLDEYSYVSVRSEGDRRKLGYLHKKVDVVPCTSMLLTNLRRVPYHVKGPSIGIHLVPGIGLPDSREGALIQYLSSLQLNAYFLPITHYMHDFNYLNVLRARLSGSKLIPILSATQTLDIISKFDYFVASSLHGAIFAYLQNVPFAALDLEKIRFFMQDRGLEQFLFRDIDSLTKAVENLFNNRPDYSDKVARDQSTLKAHVSHIKKILSLPAGTRSTVSDIARKKGGELDVEKYVQIRNLQLQNMTLAAQVRRNLKRQGEFTPDVTSKRDPLSVLLSTYYARPELQIAYPEVKEGTYDKLLQWGKDNGILEMDTRLRGIEEPNDPLSKLLLVLRTRPDLQSTFPEVNKGDYSRLLDWAKDVTTFGSDAASEFLAKDSAWYAKNPWKKIAEFDEENAKLQSELTRFEGENARLQSELTRFEGENARLQSELTRFEGENARLQSELTSQSRRLSELERELRDIRRSFGYRWMRFYASIIDAGLPEGTTRGEFRKVITRSLQMITEEGLRVYVRAAMEKLSRRQFAIIEPITEPIDPWRFELWLRNSQLKGRNLEEMRAQLSKFPYSPKISMLMPVHDSNEAWLRAAIDSVRNQVYPDWELCIVDDASTKAGVRKILNSYSANDERVKVKFLDKKSGISVASNEALAMANGEFVGFIDHDDELAVDALFSVVKVLCQDRNIDLVYSDEDKRAPDGSRVDPFFKPDWSPDLFFSMNFLGHFCVIRRKLIRKLRGFRPDFEGSQDYDLFLRATELSERIAHIPKLLYTWRMIPDSAAMSTEAKPYAREAAKRALRETLERRGLKGEVVDGFTSTEYPTGYSQYYRVKYLLQESPLVSIIIPTKNRVDLLRRCIESIESKTSYRNYEIIIIDNGSTDRDTLAYLRSIRHTVLKFDKPFNYSKLNNSGAKHAKGEHLLFLNNDTEVIEGDWLRSLIEHSVRPEVGMTGGLLLYPGTDRIQHAGIILGIGGIAGHAFKNLPAEQPYYFYLARVVRNCSAVTGACAMTRKSVFEEVGGFDEKFRVAFGDVDLCLRLRERGYLIVYTPYAMLYHHECATRGRMHPPEDEAYLLKRWKNVLAKADPYYNPNLSVFREDYSVMPMNSDNRPLAILLDAYYNRGDLQKAFPEARNGDYKRLVEWVKERGITLDAAKTAFKPYASYYQTWSPS